MYELHIYAFLPDILFTEMSLFHSQEQTLHSSKKKEFNKLIFKYLHVHVVDYILPKHDSLYPLWISFTKIISKISQSGIRGYG